MTKKELEKLIKFFYKGGAIYRKGNYDLPVDVAYFAALEHLQHGDDVLIEYDRLKAMYGACVAVTTGRSYRMRLSEANLLLWGTATEGETFWKVEAIYSEELIRFISSIVAEDLAYYEEEKQYRKRRKRASAYALNPKLRKKIFNRDGNKCKACGATERLEIDHILSVRKGGGNEDKNLQTLCSSCNSRKCDK